MVSLHNQLQCIGSLPLCGFHLEYKQAAYVSMAGKALLNLLANVLIPVVMMVLYNQSESAMLLLIISGWLGMPDSIFLQNKQNAVRNSLALKNHIFLLDKKVIWSLLTFQL